MSLPVKSLDSVLHHLPPVYAAVSRKTTINLLTVYQLLRALEPVYPTHLKLSWRRNYCTEMGSWMRLHGGWPSYRSANWVHTSGSLYLRRQIACVRASDAALGRKAHFMSMILVPIDCIRKSSRILQPLATRLPFQLPPVVTPLPLRFRQRLHTLFSLLLLLLHQALVLPVESLPHNSFLSEPMGVLWSLS